ncbi:uncharacterized protein LOC107397473 [Tribolium castaneum]|uniref:F-box domain-containing protein n=1 Tax=Tribolium castaneum TaxID=7070 RepID=D6W6Q8_TRICA|nr:PREDICTED: uncharacterized protein LOC107397473 isoform X1 [Tribolium castaneum]EFA10987.1 hypothetical protein TcasGA2_TC004155 [Tribolium castaneum]|eukprot:XP_015833133.1 PREDICTED: uncharacterized protein LOC107397473 isoform X1 [Tribolium castaneum]
MYQVFSFLAAVNLVVPKVRLPVEMWSTIFRFLDPSSLLNVVRTDGLWREISHGDPVLRRTVQEELAAERRRRHEEILNPGLLMTIERQGPTKLFGTNGTKTVRCKAPTVVQQPPVEFMRPVEKTKRRGPQRGAKIDRTHTRKLLRL